MNKYRLVYYDQFAEERIELLINAESKESAGELALEFMQGNPDFIKCVDLGLVAQDDMAVGVTHTKVQELGR